MTEAWSADVWTASLSERPPAEIRRRLRARPGGAAKCRLACRRCGCRHNTCRKMDEPAGLDAFDADSIQVCADAVADVGDVAADAFEVDDCVLTGLAAEQRHLQCLRENLSRDAAVNPGDVFRHHESPRVAAILRGGTAAAPRAENSGELLLMIGEHRSRQPYRPPVAASASHATTVRCEHVRAEIWRIRRR